MDDFNEHFAGDPLAISNTCEINEQQLRFVVEDEYTIADASQFVTARSMVTAAQELSAQILTAAKDDIAAVTAEARAQGFAAGEKQAIETLLDFMALRQKLLAHLQDDIAAMAKEVAEQLLAEVLPVNKDSLCRRVQAALLRVPGIGDVRLLVSPIDSAAVERQLAEISCGATTPVSIVADNTVRSGCAILDTDFGRIECDLNAQLEALSAVIRKSPAIAASLETLVQHEIDLRRGPRATVRLNCLEGSIEALADA